MLLRVKRLLLLGLLSLTSLARAAEPAGAISILPVELEGYLVIERGPSWCWSPNRCTRDLVPYAALSPYPPMLQRFFPTTRLHREENPEGLLSLARRTAGQMRMKVSGEHLENGWLEVSDIISAAFVASVLEAELSGNVLALRVIDLPGAKVRTYAHPERSWPPRYSLWVEFESAKTGSVVEEITATRVIEADIRELVAPFERAYVNVVSPHGGTQSFDWTRSDE